MDARNLRTRMLTTLFVAMKTTGSVRIQSIWIQTLIQAENDLSVDDGRRNGDVKERWTDRESK